MSTPKSSRPSTGPSSGNSKSEPWLSIERDRAGRWWAHVHRAPSLSELRAVKARGRNRLPVIYATVKTNRRSLHRLASFAGLRKVRDIPEKAMTVWRTA